jgi:hypothetical protein
VTKVILLACAVFFSAGAVSAKAWRGIVPLHSTRAEVEKLLGRQVEEGLGYDLEDEHVAITYSSQKCDMDLPGGWNVSPNTVIEIQVSSTRDLLMADLPVRWQDLEPTYSTKTVQISYLDARAGVRYTTDNGLVPAITYLGSAEDQKGLSCGAYKYAAPVPDDAKLTRFEQRPFESFGRMTFEHAKVFLDRFVIQLLETIKARPNSRGFILVYAGEAAHNAEAKTMADCVKNYAIKVRGADPESIVAVDAGYQNEFRVELYIMPNDSYPPMLKPTVSPKTVQILDGELEACKDGK